MKYALYNVQYNMHTVWCKLNSDLYNLHDFISEVPLLQWNVVKYIQQYLHTHFSSFLWHFGVDINVYREFFTLLFVTHCWRMLGSNLDCCEVHIDRLKAHFACYLATSCWRYYTIFIQPFYATRLSYPHNLLWQRF